MTTTETTAHTPADRRTRRVVSLSAAAAVAVAVTAGVLIVRDDGGATPAEPTTLALALPPADVMQSCIAFDVAYLRPMPVAFAGTVTAVEGDTVTLRVSTWYAGGPAELVTLDTPGANTSAALDGVAFEQGKDYLVAATDGNVNGCGFSGEATPALTQAYEQAFGD